MKSYNYYKIIFSLIALLVLSSFSPKKYVDGFKKRKKQIDSLVLIRPYVNVISHNGHDSINDIKLTDIAENILDSITNDILNKKFVLEIIETPQLNHNLLYETLDEIEDMPKIIPKISYDSLFYDEISSKQNRYALFISFRSIYNPDFPPHYKLGNAIGGIVVITPNVKTRTDSDISILILEILTKKKLFIMIGQLHQPMIHVLDPKWKT